MALLTLKSERVLLPSMAIEPAHVVIHTGRITQVLPLDHRPPTPPLDLGQLLLTPAFVNAHTHLPMTCFRGLHHTMGAGENVVEDFFFHVEARLTPEAIASFGAIGAYESLLQGVGLVWDHYYHAEALAHAIAPTGLCAVLSPTLQDLSGPGVPSCQEHWEQTLRLLHQDWAAQGIWCAPGPHATDTVSPALFSRIRTLAQAHDLPVHMHVAQSIEEHRRALARHGCSPVAWLEQMGMLEVPHLNMVHMLFATAKDLERLDPKRHTLGLCPVAQSLFDFPARADLWDACGIPWYVATDAPASNDSMHVQKELRHVGAGRTLGVSYSSDYEAFFKAEGDADAVRTLRVAHAHARGGLADASRLLGRILQVPGAMHPAFVAGVIAPGALANLVVWDTEHPGFWPGNAPLQSLAYGDVTGAIWGMMTLGKWLGEKGDFAQSLLRSQSYMQARQSAQAHFDDLVSRL